MCLFVCLGELNLFGIQSDNSIRNSGRIKGRKGGERDRSFREADLAR